MKLLLFLLPMADLTLSRGLDQSAYSGVPQFQFGDYNTYNYAGLTTQVRSSGINYQTLYNDYLQTVSCYSDGSNYSGQFCVTLAITQAITRAVQEVTSKPDNKDWAGIATIATGRKKFSWVSQDEGQGPSGDDTSGAYTGSLDRSCPNFAEIDLLTDDSYNLGNRTVRVTCKKGCTSDGINLTNLYQSIVYTQSQMQNDKAFGAQFVLYRNSKITVARCNVMIAGPRFPVDKCPDRVAGRGCYVA